MKESRKLLTRARSLRKNFSDAENLLWKHLRSRRLGGYKFRRQVVIANYIVDFCCHEVKLIVEADGGQHQDQAAYDAIRTNALELLGYRVLRFWNDDILTQTDLVLGQILEKLNRPPHPGPLPQGERGGKCK